MVDVGFFDKSESWELESRFFPCKAGGKPAWLDLLNIPETADLRCSKCSKPCIFLCQIYAPISEKSDCFHRTIFIFLCMNPECCQGNGEENFKVFRCQLPRKNEFYPYEPPVEEKSWHPNVNVNAYNSMCVYCGCKGDLKCASCKEVTYCCKEHQVLDWKSGHKNDCKTGKRMEHICNLLPEFEIMIEPERPADRTDPVDRCDEEKLEDFKKMAQAGDLGTLSDERSIDEDLMNMALAEEDKQFHKYKARVQQTPSQILRYELDGEPLWVSVKNEPKSIPNCQYCGEPRRFEFQILSQALNYFSFDSLTNSIDWGTLAIFTCKDSCDGGPRYKSEYLWKQDFSD